MRYKKRERNATSKENEFDALGNLKLDKNPKNIKGRLKWKNI